jgi:serine/threonine-protein kinase HipA
MTGLILQVHHHNGWHDAAEIDLVNPQAGIRSAAAVSYDLGYVADWDVDGLISEKPAIDCRAVSVNYPTSFTPISSETWPAFLLDLLPQGAARRNLIGRLNLGNADDPAIEFPLLLRGASAPIGNLRLKEAWAEEQERLRGQQVAGLTIDELRVNNEKLVDILERFSLIASGSSGVQGEWPKILLTQANDGLWYPDSFIGDKDARRHIILKLARAEKDDKFRLILEAEAPYLEVARAFGLHVSQPLTLIQDCLIIPRFDREVRNGQVIRHGQESLVSALNRAEFGYLGRHELYIAKLREVSADPQTDVIEYVLRDLLNFAMGNSDNHGRNTALQKPAFPDQGGSVRLSPLFDFTPMTLHPDGVPRSTRWSCLNGQDMKPDWRLIVAAVADGENEQFRERLISALKSKIEFLANLPAVANKCGVPPEVIQTACARHLDAANALKALP